MPARRLKHPNAAAWGWQPLMAAQGKVAARGTLGFVNFIWLDKPAPDLKQPEVRKSFDAALEAAVANWRVYNKDDEDLVK